MDCHCACMLVNTLLLLPLLLQVVHTFCVQ
jgi:hypothetical protein